MGESAFHSIDRMFNLIDLLIVAIVAWASIIGWRRGGTRSLIDSASVGSAIAVVLLSITFVRDRLIDGSWALVIRKWIRENLRSIPTTAGFATENAGVADNLYHLLIVGVGAITVWIGLQMILQVFQTVWRVPHETPVSRMAGTLIGTGMGSAFAWYMVQCLGLLSWIKGFEALDSYLGSSYFVWLMMNLTIR